MAREITLMLGSPNRPTRWTLSVDPLPSGLPSVLIALRAPRSASIRRRVERVFQRRVRVDGETQWEPLPSRRAVAWRELVTPRGGTWWVCGPLSHHGPQFADVLSAISRDTRRLERLMQRRDLAVIDECSLQRVGLVPPPQPAPPAPLDEDDDDNAVAPEAA